MLTDAGVDPTHRATHAVRRRPQSQHAPSTPDPAAADPHVVEPDDLRHRLHGSVRSDLARRPRPTLLDRGRRTTRRLWCRRLTLVACCRTRRARLRADDVGRRGRPARDSSPSASCGPPPVGARLSAPTPQQARTEVLLRSLNAAERLARLDLALRAAAPSLASQAASVHAVVMYDNGEVCLFLRGARLPRDRVDARPARQHLECSAHRPRSSMLAHAGTSERTAVPGAGARRWSGRRRRVVRRPGGGRHADGAVAARVRDPRAASRHRLAVSPFLEATRLFTVGLGDVARSVHRTASRWTRSTPRSMLPR